ncbi:MAG TPA: DUF1835 domain-containing protein, partial [Chitinophagaceae bacterium]|nr:DUF1835 domain-containing protein [Chitinophagaceae bacterium]
MIHIVFQQKDVEIIGKAIELDESLNGEIIEIKDDYAVGAIDSLNTEEGWQLRQDWWKSLLAASPYEDNTGAIDDRVTLQIIKQKLEDRGKEIVWIWMGQNGHDVCGYYWLISQLKEYVGRIFVLYLNNLPFINEKGQIFYPTTLHQILPKEFLK